MSYVIHWYFTINNEKKIYEELQDSQQITLKDVIRIQNIVYKEYKIEIWNFTFRIYENGKEVLPSEERRKYLETLKKRLEGDLI